MKHKIFLFTFSLFIILFFGCFEQVLACGSRDFLPSVCEMYGKSKAVFVGRIKSITEIKKEGFASNFKVDFQVQEAFLGIKNQTLTSVMVFGASIKYCSFEKDKSYLVYAYRGNDGFSIDAGTRTKPLAEAAEDLEFLRNLTEAKSGARLYGNIMKAVKSSLEENNEVPVANMRLKVMNKDNKSQVFYTTTDENGNYEVKGIPDGTHVISPAIPLDRYYFAPKTGSGEFEVNDKGCIGRSFTLTPNNNNKFIGRVIDAEGKPVAQTDIEILSIYAKKPNGYVGEEFANTNPDGTFYEYNIPPGLYTISINYSNPPSVETPYPTVFYPGVSERVQAAVIEIRAGEDITDFEFRLPPRLAPKTIRGKVLWADGTPAIGVKVHLKDNEFDICCINSGVKTDARGNFTQTGYEGRNYRAFAARNEDASTDPLYGVSSSFFADTAKTQTIIINLTRAEFEKVFESDDNN